MRVLEVGAGGRVRLVPGRTVCAGCGAPIVWRRTKAGRFQPVNPDGVAHFATCPDAEAFRRLSRRRAVGAVDVRPRLL
jgi:hypothetical protein